MVNQKIPYLLRSNPTPANVNGTLKSNVRLINNVIKEKKIAALLKHK
jgi:hypothetical protein